MRKSDVFPEYWKSCDGMESLYASMSGVSGVDGLMRLRGYVDDGQRDALASFGVAYCDLPEEDFLLNGRYVVPIHDVGGRICSLVGYYPDSRKYITMPTPFFSKECQFFNFRRAYERSGGSYCFVVEGIFDCVSMDGLGLPCVAAMGASVSEVKGELLKLFDKVVAIPDGDEAGRRALTRWSLPYGSVRVRLDLSPVQVGNVDIPCKDMDDLIRYYDRDDVREMLESLLYEREEVVDLCV